MKRREEIQHPDITKMRLYGSLEEEKAPAGIKCRRYIFKSETGALLTSEKINDIIKAINI